MYSLFTILEGSVITLMVWCNSTLAGKTGNRLSLIFIHLAGLITVIVLKKIRKVKWKPLKVKPYLLAAGVTGVGVVLLQNSALMHIGTALTVALTLTGQLVASFCIDNFGLFDMPKQKLTVQKIVPLVPIVIGLVLILGGKL